MGRLLQRHGTEKMVIDYNSQEYAKTQIKGEIKLVKRAELPKRHRKGSLWFAKGDNFEVAKLRENRLAYARPDKTHSAQWLNEVFPEVISRLLAGEIFTIESFQKLGYYEYLKAKLNPVCHTEGYDWKKGLQHLWSKKFCDLVKVVKSIKAEGLRSPLDMFMDGRHPVLIRGYRRLEILHQLGKKTVPVRVWRNEWLSKRFIPTASWGGENGVHGSAIKQFIKYGHKATDKYWVHGYTPYYDFHLRGRRKIKILELGVKEGMSVDLWHRAFPMAEIHGIDNKPERQWDRLVKKDRIHLHNIDYTDPTSLKSLAKEHGPFDMIIDDGIHRPIPQKDAFNVLWDYLAPNGLYVVEDIHCNYRDNYIADTAMPTFTKLVDDIWTTNKVKTVAFYPNILFIEKA